MTVERAVLFTVGAVGSGALLYGLAGALGLLARPVLLPLAAAAFGFSFFWHGRHSGLLPFARRSIEANGRLVRGRPGLIYFGSLLGVGILTEMSTPLVWSGIAYSIASGLPWALIYGAGFGLGRSVPALAAIPTYDRHINHGAVATLLVATVRRELRYVAIATAAVGGVTTAAMFITLVRT